MKYNDEQGVAKTYHINNKIWNGFKDACRDNKKKIQPQMQDAIVSYTEHLLAIKNNEHHGLELFELIRVVQQIVQVNQFRLGTGQLPCMLGLRLAVHPISRNYQNLWLIHNLSFFLTTNFH